jgi:16S rRNA (adenine1518-N6/adenine1519-N6)-dimethyltransferase
MRLEVDDDRIRHPDEAGRQMTRPTHALPALKRFGQHFLIDTNLARKIVEFAGAAPGAGVIEIGPGRGMLTTQILEKGAIVRAVEIDHGACTQLREKYAEEIAGNRFSLYEGDVLRHGWDEMAPPDFRLLIANLPYNITTHFLLRLCETPDRFDAITLMLQRDAIERVTAGPVGREGGYPNFRLHWAFRVEFGFPVGRRVFDPPPHVDSAVIKLTPRPDRPRPANEALLFRMVEAGYHQRRRMLRQSLRSVLTDPILQQAAAERPDLLVLRGEALDEAGWLALLGAVSGDRDA